MHFAHLNDLLLNPTHKVSSLYICPNIFGSTQFQKFTGNEPLVVRMMMSKIERHPLLNA